MNFTSQQSLAFCQENFEILSKLQQKLIICPPAPVIPALAQLFEGTEVAVCAQSCSAHTSGAFTGQISATSLAQVGCSYVLVGHSEERVAFRLSHEDVAQKTLRVLEAGMIPVVCIGEPQNVRNGGNTQEFLEEQLFHIKRAVGGAPLYVAYEPIWAIGTNKTPTSEELSFTYEQLKLFMQGCAYLYGGSVNSKTIAMLEQVKEICGYLVGSASHKIDELKQIMER